MPRSAWARSAASALVTTSPLSVTVKRGVARNSASSMNSGLIPESASAERSAPAPSPTPRRIRWTRRALSRRRVPWWCCPRRRERRRRRLHRPGRASYARLLRTPGVGRVHRPAARRWGRCPPLGRAPFQVAERGFGAGEVGGRRPAG